MSCVQSSNAKEFLRLDQKLKALQKATVQNPQGLKLEFFGRRASESPVQPTGRKVCAFGRSSRFVGLWPWAMPKRVCCFKGVWALGTLGIPGLAASIKFGGLQL